MTHSPRRLRIAPQSAQASMPPPIWERRLCAHVVVGVAGAPAAEPVAGEAPVVFGGAVVVERCEYFAEGDGRVSASMVGEGDVSGALATVDGGGVVEVDVDEHGLGSCLGSMRRSGGSCVVGSVPVGEVGGFHGGEVWLVEVDRLGGVDSDPGRAVGGKGEALDRLGGDVAEAPPPDDGSDRVGGDVADGIAVGLWRACLASLTLTSSAVIRSTTGAELLMEAPGASGAISGGTAVVEVGAGVVEGSENCVDGAGVGRVVEAEDGGLGGAGTPVVDVEPDGGAIGGVEVEFDVDGRLPCLASERTTLRRTYSPMDTPAASALTPSAAQTSSGRRNPTVGDWVLALGIALTLAQQGIR